MSYMLDTNTCAFITKKDPAVLAAVKAHLKDGLFISTITLSEIEFGICNSAAPVKYREALMKLFTVLAVLPYDGAAAATHGILRADLKKRGCLIGNMDMLIAAHAKSCELTLVTNNIEEFQRVQGLDIEDWKCGMSDR